MQNTVLTTVGADKVYSASYVSDNILSPINNVWDNFLQGEGNSTSTGLFLGSHAVNCYNYMTFEETRVLATGIARSLSNSCNVGDNIGIFSKNCVEWVLVDLGCAAGKFVSVPLFDNFTEEAISHVIAQTEMKVIFVSADKLSLLKTLKDTNRIPHLQQIIIFGNNSSDVQIDGVVIVNFMEFSREGSLEDNVASIASTSTRDDVFTICYTSGTTGMPKGVVLTHGNFMAEIDALEYAGNAGKLFVATKDDSHFSYLPLAHIFERVMVHYMARVGARIAFSRGDTKLLMDDLAIAKPTLFISVPRLLNRIYDGTMETVAKKGCISRKMFNFALNRRLKVLTQRNHPNRHVSTRQTRLF